jgi:hypothetical protein
VYLPTYAAVASLRIGVEPTATLQPLRPYSADEKPILIWGSSIAQGGVVTNAGMTWPSNLQRIMDRPLLNFGFSGSCEMQPAIAAVLGALKPSVFVMDCLPNMQQDSPEQVSNATLAVLKLLRKALGDSVPIITLEGHEYTNNWIKVAQAVGQDGLCSAQHTAVSELQKVVPNLHYTSSLGKLGDDNAVAGESTGGMGVHPTALAHLHMAEFVAQKLHAIERGASPVGGQIAS